MSQLKSQQLPQADDAKYLGFYLDRRLTWRKHKMLDCTSDLLQAIDNRNASKLTLLDFSKAFDL